MKPNFIKILIPVSKTIRLGQQYSEFLGTQTQNISSLWNIAQNAFHLIDY